MKSLREIPIVNQTEALKKAEELKIEVAKGRQRMITIWAS